MGFYKCSEKLNVVMCAPVTNILHSVTSKRAERELWKIEFALPPRI
jgi:hypothetical protein